MSRILSSDVIASLVTKMIKCRVILSSSLMEQSGWWSVQPDRSQRLHLSNDIEIDLLFRRDTSQRFHRFHRHPPPLDSQKTAQHHRLGHHRFILDVLRSGHHRIHLLGLVSGRFRLPGVYVVVVGVPHGLLLLNMLLALTDRFVAINYPLLHREKMTARFAGGITFLSSVLLVFLLKLIFMFRLVPLRCEVCLSHVKISWLVFIPFVSCMSSISRCTGWPRLNCVNLDGLV